MPSRMLVVLTARIALVSMPGDCNTARMHSEMSRQLVAVSKTCEPGTPSIARWLHSRWAIATCRPPVSNTTARQLPVPASSASSRGSLQVPRGQCRVESSLVDKRLASCIDEVGAGPHCRKLRPAEEVLGVGARAHVQRDEIGDLEECRQAGQQQHATKIVRL